MASSYTASLRLEKQVTGASVNTWGILLNSAIDRIDFSIAGLTTIALTGSTYSLSSSNTATDEARSAALKFTGSTACVVTIPSLSKIYLVWNATSAVVTLTTGSGTTVAMDAGDIFFVLCDATNVKTISLGISGTSTALKAYIDSVVVGGGDSLPSVTGNNGKLLTNNGTIPSWAQPTVSYLSDYTSDQSTRHAATLASATALAVAFAVSL